VLSLNVGSEVPVERIPGAECGYAVKPISNLWRLRQDLQARLGGAGALQPTIRIVIIGGGATGCEIAANILGMAHDHGSRSRVTVTILARGTSVLEQLPPRAAHSVARALQRRGAVIKLQAEVTRVDDGVFAVTHDGYREPFDVLVDARGLRPSSLVATMQLPTDREGALLVDDTLRSVADPSVHGGGDCVALRGIRLDRVGVFAVREAPILFHNLLAYLDGTPARRFSPQKRYLLILNLGDGTAVAVRGSCVWRGRSAFYLKDYIDRRFLAQYRIPDSCRPLATSS